MGSVTPEPGSSSPAPTPSPLAFGVPVGDDATIFYPWVIYSIPNTTPATTSNRLISAKVYIQWQERATGPSARKRSRPCGAATRARAGRTMPWAIRRITR